MQKLRSIQVLRAVAVLPVVFFHYADFRVGRAGVDLFFCISGFVMAGLVDRRPAQFALDRFTRIYPPFLAAIALLMLFTTPAMEPLRLLRTLLLDPDPRAIYLYPAWSLSYEALFYAGCVVSMLVGGRVVLFAYGLCFLLKVPFLGSAFTLEFLAGFAIARRQWRALPLLLVAATSDMRVLSYGPPAAVLLWLFVDREQWFRSARWRPLTLIGDASYAIYLTHTFTGETFVSWGLAPVIYACLAAGLLFHFLAEKPLLSLTRRLLTRSRRPEAVAVPEAPVARQITR